MMLKTTVQIVDDPRKRQAKLNEYLTESGQEAPELAGQQFEQQMSSGGAQASAQASRVAQPASPSGTRVHHHGLISAHIEAQHGVPLANQPVGCRVVIHTPIATEEVAPGVHVHKSSAIPEKALVAPKKASKKASKKKASKKKASKKKASKKG